MRADQIRRLLLAAVVAAAAAAPAGSRELPVRKNPAPPTTSGVPHVQLGVTPVPELSEELLRRVEALPGVEIRPTVVSLPGALGFWIDEEVSLARPDTIVGGREFAHLHPDGSLHASLSPALAAQAVERGWATPHPWADQRPGWEGFVMIYTPLSADELDVVFRLVAAGLDFVKNGDPEADPGQTQQAPARAAGPRQDPSVICTTC